MNDQEYLEHVEEVVKSTIFEFGLLSKPDRIAVALSGGKDSVAVLFMLKKWGYDVFALTFDVMIGDWSAANQRNIRRICSEFGVELHEISCMDEFGCRMPDIHAAVREKTGLENCAICGIIKRWILNRKARELGATKLVTGHNLDDEAQNIFMNLVKGNPALSVGLGPATGVGSDPKFVQRVKPLYFLLNDELERYTRIHGFDIVYERCPSSTGVFRRDIKNKLDALEKEFPGSKRAIVRKYLSMKPDIVEKFGSEGQLSYCEVCGEPTRGKVCKLCEIMKYVRVK